jgi:hypothetical protein
MSYSNCHFPPDQEEKHRCFVDSSIFQWRPHFFYSNNCSRNVLIKNWRLCTVLWPLACALHGRIQKIDTKPLYGRQTFDNKF